MNLYDKMYEHSPIYGNDMSTATDAVRKFRYIEECLNEFNPKTILDVGCGQGHYTREMLKRGYDVVGLEYSSYCCEKYLSDVPHICTSIVDYVQVPNIDKVDSIVCMDVLEHLRYEDIEVVLSGFSRIANSCILGIANHSDKQLGEELHIIQENCQWWIDKVEKVYPSVQKVVSLYRDRFFIIKASR